MKSIATASILAFLRLFASVQIGSAQDLSLPLQPGMAVVTCFAGSVDDNSNITIKPDDYVMGILDVRIPPAAMKGRNWTPPMYHHPTWTARNLGQIFGLALDGRANMYVTASSMYGLPSNTSRPGVFGPGGPGAIYKIDRATGEISLFAQLPNTRPGLGNICYDRRNRQFFVTNFEDGAIYRLDLEGNVLGSFDPFTRDNGTSGIVDFGERLWGVGISDGRVYYAVWKEDFADGAFAQPNEVWSVGLDEAGDFIPASNERELIVPEYPTRKTTGRALAVSDIAFAPDGRMLLAEVTFFRYIGATEYFGRLLEYRRTPGGWSGPKTIYVGDVRNHTNAQGGADYGYDNAAPPSESGCYGSIWVTGNPLIVDNVANAGLTGIPAEGNTTANVRATSFFIDADGVLTENGYVKALMGDVEIFKQCCVDEPPDSIRASIGRHGPVEFMKDVLIDIRLDDPLEEYGPEALELSFGYDRYAMRPVGMTLDSIAPSLDETLLENWKIESVTDDGAGTVVLIARPPHGGHLRDTGTLLRVRFETFLGFGPSTSVDSIGIYRLPVSLRLDGLTCTDVTTDPGTLKLEFCGLQYRLIEITSSKYAVLSATNPMREKGEIVFSLGLDGPTALEVFDAAGRRVAWLIDGEILHSGEYRLTWDASRLPAGLYFYRLRSGDWEESRKVIVR